jgi:hypothetical protein
MNVVKKQLRVILLLLSGAIAQNTSEPVKLEDLRVSREGADLKVVVFLSSPVQASAEIAHHPDRLLLQLPGTIDANPPRKIGINANGVRAIHTVLAYPGRHGHERRY